MFCPMARVLGTYQGLAFTPGSRCESYTVIASALSYPNHLSRYLSGRWNADMTRSCLTGMMLCFRRHSKPSRSIPSLTVRSRVAKSARTKARTLSSGNLHCTCEASLTNSPRQYATLGDPQHHDHTCTYTHTHVNRPSQVAQNGRRKVWIWFPNREAQSSIMQPLSAQLSIMKQHHWTKKGGFVNK